MLNSLKRLTLIRQR